MPGPPPRHPGALVWCKLRGFTELWAGLIVDPATATPAARAMRQANTFLVSFFPDSAFQWVPPEKIFDFEDNYEKYAKQPGVRGKTWRQGLEEAKELLEERKKKETGGSNEPADSATVTKDKEKEKEKDKDKKLGSAESTRQPRQKQSRSDASPSAQSNPSVAKTNPSPPSASAVPSIRKSGLAAASSTQVSKPSPTALDKSPLQSVKQEQEESNLPKRLRRKPLASAAGAAAAEQPKPVSAKPRLPRATNVTPTTSPPTDKKEAAKGPNSAPAAIQPSQLSSKLAAAILSPAATVSTVQPAMPAPKLAWQCPLVALPEQRKPATHTPSAAVSAWPFTFTFSRFPSLKKIRSSQHPKQGQLTRLPGRPGAAWEEEGQRPFTGAHTIFSKAPAGSDQQSGSSSISPYADWPNYIQATSPTAEDMRACSSQDALAWLRSLARGAGKHKALSSSAAQSAHKRIMAIDRQARCTACDALRSGTLSPTSVAAGGSMKQEEPGIKKAHKKTALNHVARITVPTRVGAAQQASLPSPDGAAPVVSVILNVNGKMLPFLSPASLHSTMVVARGDSNAVYQVSGLQGALAAFGPCAKFVEGWQHIAPGLLLMSLHIPDIHAARTPQPPMGTRSAAATAKAAAAASKAGTTAASALAAAVAATAAASAAAEAAVFASSKRIGFGSSALGGGGRIPSVRLKQHAPRITLQRTVVPAAGFRDEGVVPLGMESGKRVKIVLQQQRLAAVESEVSDGSGSRALGLGRGKGKMRLLLQKGKAARQVVPPAQAVPLKLMSKQAKGVMRFPGPSGRPSATGPYDPAKPFAHPGHVGHQFVPIPVPPLAAKRPRESAPEKGPLGCSWEDDDDGRPAAKRPSSGLLVQGRAPGSSRGRQSASRSGLRPRQPQPNWYGIVGGSSSGDEGEDGEYEEEEEEKEEEPVHHHHQQQQQQQHGGASMRTASGWGKHRGGRPPATGSGYSGADPRRGVLPGLQRSMEHERETLLYEGPEFFEYEGPLPAALAEATDASRRHNHHTHTHHHHHSHHHGKPLLDSGLNDKGMATGQSAAEDPTTRQQRVGAGAAAAAVLPAASPSGHVGKILLELRVDSDEDEVTILRGSSSAWSISQYYTGTGGWAGGSATLQVSTGSGWGAAPVLSPMEGCSTLLRAQLWEAHTSGSSPSKKASRHGGRSNGGHRSAGALPHMHNNWSSGYEEEEEEAAGMAWEVPGTTYCNKVTAVADRLISAARASSQLSPESKELVTEIGREVLQIASGLDSGCSCSLDVVRRANHLLSTAVLERLQLHGQERAMFLSLARTLMQVG